MPRILNKLVDSLHLRVGSTRPPSRYLTSQVSLWRQYQAEYDFDNPQDYFVEFPNLGTFRLLPRGKKTYEFVFINPEIGDIRLWNPDKWATSLQTGQFYLDFRSKYLQHQNLQLDTTRGFVTTLQKLFYSGKPEISASNFKRVSRGDLAADVELDSGLDWSDLNKFVCKARKQRIYPFLAPENFGLADVEKLFSAWDALVSPEQDNKGVCASNLADDFALPSKLVPLVRQLLNDYFSPKNAQLTIISASRNAPQTLYFGQFASALYCRIYDKKLSLAVQNKEYMREIWADAGWLGELPVWRVEFSLSGDFLKDSSVFGDDFVDTDLRDFSKFCSKLPDIWRYLTHEWLRHSDPSGDRTHTSQWRTSAFWKTVQAAFELPDTQYLRRKHPNPVTSQLQAQAEGCLLSWAALAGFGKDAYDGVSDVVNGFNEWLTSFDFEAKLLDRARRLGVDSFTDTVLSAQFRADRMAEGCGS